MNKCWYSFGNPIKVKFREHYCYKCGTKLFLDEHRKVVSQKSEEAKYYSFHDASGSMIGPCEFIHNVFYCPKCFEQIEFVTQINREDIDILIEKVQVYFRKKGRKVSIKKGFENEKNVIKYFIEKMELIRNLCFIIEEEGKETLIYKVPISRKESWERPYYFKVKKKDLLNFIRKESFR
jgi:hypothetical protein